MIFAACVLVALAASSGSQSAPSSLAMKRFARQQELQAEGNETTLEGEGAGEGEAAAGGMAKVPAMPKIDFSWDKIRFPTTWAALHQTFGVHLWFTIFVIFCASLTWGYVNYVRPRMQKEENDGDEALLDENDVTANLILIPGEEIFFHSEEPFTQNWLEVLFCGCGNRVWKLGVTNKRIVAQKKESTCFGTCQLNAREDCWPIENVAKVSVISGEFWGYSVPMLWSMATNYFIVTVIFDLAGGVFRETIKEMFGSEASDPIINKGIFFIDLGIMILCNVLFVLAVIYAIAVMMLIIFPHSLVKVYMTRDLEEDGNPLNKLCCGCHCTGPNSKPMETFTFKTGSSYKAYAAIMAARAGAGNPTKSSA